MARLSLRLEQVRNQPVHSLPADIDQVEVTFLRLGEITKRTGLSRSTIYTKMNQGKFPQSVRLGARRVAVAAILHG